MRLTPFAMTFIGCFFIFLVVFNVSFYAKHQKVKQVNHWLTQIKKQQPDIKSIHYTNINANLPSYWAGSTRINNLVITFKKHPKNLLFIGSLVLKNLRHNPQGQLTDFQATLTQVSTSKVTKLFQRTVINLDPNLKIQLHYQQHQLTARIQVYSHNIPLMTQKIIFKKRALPTSDPLTLFKPKTWQHWIQATEIQQVSTIQTATLETKGKDFLKYLMSELPRIQKQLPRIANEIIFSSPFDTSKLNF